MEASLVDRNPSARRTARAGLGRADGVTALSRVLLAVVAGALVLLPAWLATLLDVALD
jgi:hypothetical protein